MHTFGGCLQLDVGERAGRSTSPKSFLHMMHSVLRAGLAVGQARGMPLAGATSACDDILLRKPPTREESRQLYIARDAGLT
jgi:hypothetical protein